MKQVRGNTWTADVFIFVVREVHKRRYLLQPMALEVFSGDGRNYLLAFPRKVRNKVYQRFMAFATAIADSAQQSVAGQKRTANVEQGAGLLSSLIGTELFFLFIMLLKSKGIHSTSSACCDFAFWFFIMFFIRDTNLFWAKLMNRWWYRFYTVCNYKLYTFEERSLIFWPKN